MTAAAKILAAAFFAQTRILRLVFWSVGTTGTKTIIVGAKHHVSRRDINRNHMGHRRKLENTLTRNERLSKLFLAQTVPDF